MKRFLVLALVLTTGAACGSAEQIRFVADKEAAPGTVTLVEAGFAPTAYGGIVFVDAMVVDSKPITDLNFDLSFDHRSFGVVDVTLGDFFPKDGQRVAITNKTSLLTWEVRREGWNESVLHIDIGQDSVAGAPVSVPGKHPLFGVVFHAAEAGAATGPVKSLPSTMVRGDEGKTLYTSGPTVRTGTLKTE